MLRLTGKVRTVVDVILIHVRRYRASKCVVVLVMGTGVDVESLLVLVVWGLKSKTYLNLIFGVVMGLMWVRRDAGVGSRR